MGTGTELALGQGGTGTGMNWDRALGQAGTGMGVNWGGEVLGWLALEQG